MYKIDDVVYAITDEKGQRYGGGNNYMKLYPTRVGAERQIYPGSDKFVVALKLVNAEELR